MNTNRFSRSVMAFSLLIGAGASLAPVGAAPAAAPPKSPVAPTPKTAQSAAKTPPKAVPATKAPVGATSPPKTAAKAAPTPPPTPVPLVYVPPLAATPLESGLVRLPNGITLVTRRDRLAPRVAFSLLIKAGAADETAKSAGWRHLLADAMLRGSKDASGTELKVADVQRAAENLGGRSGATVSDDAIEFWAIGDSAKQGELLDLLLQMVLRPRLSDDDITAARERLTTRLENEADNVPAQAVNALREQLYRDSDNVPVAYGLPGTGTDESLKALTAARLRSLHRVFFAPAQMALAAVGDLDEATLRGRLEKLEKGAAPDAGDAELPRPGNVPRLVAPAKDKPPLVVRQLPTRGALPVAWLFVGFAGPGADSADLPALRVLCAALGEMPRSRLEKRLLGASLIPGLDDSNVFQAAAQWTPRRYAGEMVVFAQTKAESIEEIKNALLDEVGKLRTATLSAAELDRARNFARGGWAVERETLRDRAFQAAFAPVANAPADVKWPERVAAVTAADIKRVAAKYLQNYAVTLVMPED